MPTRASEKTVDITQLDCWREAREFVKSIYDLTGGDSFRDDALIVQVLRRDAISVMSRISQGYHHRKKTVFLDFLNQAIGSLGEAISHLYVAFDQNYLSREDLNGALSRAYTVGIKINSYQKSLQGKRK
jgi:four helix bundle protein